ncbi:MAG TPA: hypothetical protein VLB86_00870 [Gaiellaceae bacterium]|nr:hypothetical protein [Gaiellaceae bacterium]
MPRREVDLPDEVLALDPGRAAETARSEAASTISLRSTRIVLPARKPGTS